MPGYTKLAGSLLDSTVWVGQTVQTKVVWITILAMKDANGEVFASVPGLAQRAGVTIPECEEALRIFLAPDPYSRTKDFDGRRVEVIDGGWFVLNHDKYKFMESAENRREKAAIRQRRHRERKSGVTGVTCNASNASLRHTDTDPNTDQRGREEPPPPVPTTDGLRSGPLTGYELTRVFGRVRSMAMPSALPWQTPSMRDGKDSAMAEVINGDPTARADVIPTMQLLYAKAAEGKCGKNSPMILQKPAFAFACWISDWTALREELHGRVPGAQSKSSLELAQDADNARWRDR